MTSVILAGWCAAAAAALFRGPSPELLSLLPFAVAAGLSAGTPLFPLTVILFSASLLSPSALPWAVTAGGILCSTTGKGGWLRLSGFLSLAFVLWVYPVKFIVPVLAVSAAGAFFHGRKAPVYLAAVGTFILSSLFYGIPEPALPPPLISESRIENGVISYGNSNIYTGNGELLLPAPSSGSWLMWLAIDPGGVRDTLPMAAVSIGEEMLFLPRGADTLCFTFCPGDTLRVKLMRDFNPFAHPVIHVSAGGERL